MLRKRNIVEIANLRYYDILIKEWRWWKKIRKFNNMKKIKKKITDGK